jgi:ATP-binding cassette, subfamily B, bacterial PglK
MLNSPLLKGWSLLAPSEKRQALLVLVVVILSAATSALMIGSVMPFLAALADPEKIRRVAIFDAIYRIGGFRSDYGFLVALGLASLSTIVIANLIQMVRLYLVVEFATMRMHTLSTRLLKIYLRHPYEYFLHKHSGELGTQILSETQQVVLNFFRPAAEVIASGLTVLAIVCLLIWLDPIVAAITFTVAGGLYVTAFALSQRAARHYGNLRASSNQKRFKVVNEALAGVKELKLLGRESNYVGTYESASMQMTNAEAVGNLVSQLPQYVMQIVAFGGMIVLVLSLLDPLSLRSASLSRLLPLLGVFAFAGQRLIPELAKLYAGITQISYGAPIVRAICDDLAAERTLPALTPVSVAPMRLRHSLVLRNVTYAYPNASAGLTGLCMSIRAGERIGIVGGSGAGKTTLADVLMGLLPHHAGEILVDGQLVTDATITAWQRSIGYVQQSIFLSDASIVENIALGISKQNIDRERALDAARLAKLDDFVCQELPHAYDTLVGERGVRLSGGQRQRIGIARALYNNADLFVFDEATSALDNATEREVMDSIDALPGHKTVILIAHRLSTLRNCDRLIVLDKGTAVGVGTWNELLATNEHFQRLSASAAWPSADASNQKAQKQAS